MLSPEKAKALKEAGLVWEPQDGDCFVGPTGNVWFISGEHRLVDELGGTMWFFGGGLCNRDGGCLANETHSFCLVLNEKGFKFEGLRVLSVASVDEQVWLPSLSQLLAEIKKRSEFAKITWLIMEQKWDCVVDGREQFLADTPDDATADALLHLLAQGKPKEIDREE